MMTDYNSFTNAELEKEIEALEKAYGETQQVAQVSLEMLDELSSQYEAAKRVLDKRQGKLKGDSF